MLVVVVWCAAPLVVFHLILRRVSNIYSRLIDMNGFDRLLD